MPHVCVSPSVWSWSYVCVDRDRQQGQRSSSIVSACFVSGRGPGRRDTSHETVLERRAGEEADLWGDFQTGENTVNTLWSRSTPLYTVWWDDVSVLSFSCDSSRTSPRERRPTSSTLCCACWSSTHPTWRIWSERGPRSWRWRDRRQTNCWLRCCPSECPAT